MTGPRIARHSVDAELIQTYDVPGPRYTSYPTAVSFDEHFGESDYLSALADAAQGHGPLSLYSHLPFCEARCHYCACNVVITRRRDVAERYLESLSEEIALVAGHLKGRRKVAQFHFGGGTPTFYSPADLRGLMATYRRYFEFEKGAELAVEIDPRVTSRDHLEALAAEGFTRLSLGIQDFSPEVQSAINRVQSVGETRVVVQEARRLGFASVNFDLIYGLPNQSAASFETTLQTVVALRPDRLAIYSLAYLPKVKRHQRLMPEAELPRGLEKYEILALAREVLVEAGYLDIGMDHFALPGDELSLAQERGELSRNFMGYTVSKAPEVLGFGLSSIGDVAGRYIQNTKKLNRYIESLTAGSLPVARGYRLNSDDRLRREVIHQWMCNFAIDKARLSQAYRLDFDSYFKRELNDLKDLEVEGLVELRPTTIVASELGRRFPRNVAMVFDSFLRDDKVSRDIFSRTV